MYDIQTKTIIDRRELLKIKALSLMVEAGLIRREEQKQRAFGRSAALADPILQREMQLHRVGVLRKQARLTHIARGFIKGLTLPQMEQYPKNLLTGNDWAEIAKMVMRYGNADATKFHEAQRQQYAYKVYAFAQKVERKSKPQRKEVAFAFKSV